MIVATGEATLKSGGQVLRKDRLETLKHKQKLFVHRSNFFFFREASVLL